MPLCKSLDSRHMLLVGQQPLQDWQRHSDSCGLRGHYDSVK
jgi:hypothetical protein